MWFIDALRHTPSLAIFLTIGLGFLLGKIKFKGFSLGTVTSVLIVGVLVGQLNIDVGGPLKTVSFMLFLFCIGYSVGPQFFRSLRGDGLKEVIFAVVMCILILVTAFGVALWMGLDPGQAAGMMAGASTASPVVGAAEDTVAGLSLPKEQVDAMLNAIPVCYAMTYVFGTIGAVWLLGYIGPAMMGGIEKVRQMTREYEKTHTASSASDNPAFIDACRKVAFRAFRTDGTWMTTPHTASEIEKKYLSQGRPITVERVRRADGTLIDTVSDTVINPGDTIVISSRREFVIGDNEWLGHEVPGTGILTFPVEDVQITVSRRFTPMTIHNLVEQGWMYGVQIKNIWRNGSPVTPKDDTLITKGDIIEVVGRKKEVTTAADHLGYADVPTLATDFVFVGLGTLLGGLLGTLAVKFGNVSISLGTSGGALIAGLLLGWIRSKRPVYGAIPKASLWVFNNLGLNMYIAVIGIASGPSFISSFEAVGPKIFIAGLIVTLIPMFIGLILSFKVFKFHPAIALGCCAGARKTTAGLGAVQERLGSSVPAIGYTITYAVSNTVLIIFGIILVLLLA
ncbi:MAG: aspartate-alanine antiporter [Paramuribaculum sp.]|nr:aspartate-alanine antiporter [Paramuribaculum sp.]